MANDEPIEAPECIRCEYISECDIRDKMIVTDKKCLRYKPRNGKE